MTTFRPKARCGFGRVAKTLAPKPADREPEGGGLIFDKNRSNLEVNRAGEQNYTDIMKFSKKFLGVDVPIAQITSRTRPTNCPKCVRTRRIFCVVSGVIFPHGDAGSSGIDFKVRTLR